MSLFGLSKEEKAERKKCYEEGKAIAERQTDQLDEVIAIGKRNVEIMSSHIGTSKAHLEFMLRVGYLTRREIMAMNILQGLLASGKEGINANTALAYDYADELIKLGDECSDE